MDFKVYQAEGYKGHSVLALTMHPFNGHQQAKQRASYELCTLISLATVLLQLSKPHSHQ